MKNTILKTLVISLFLFASNANAGLIDATKVGSYQNVASANLGSTLIDASIAIPDANVLMNFNGSGIDWVYAAPIAPSFGGLQLPGYRASEGWRFASVLEWAARPDWTDFIIGGATVNPGTHSDHSTYRFASEYWTDRWSHVDLGDVVGGFLTNGNGLGSSHHAAETWYVRDNNANPQPVPEPATMLLLGTGLLGIVRMRKQALTA